jgi:hypothetical protein
VQRRSLAWRGALAVAAAVSATTPLAALPRLAGAATQTACASGTLARQRTEVDTDIAVARFDPSLGTLLSVSVPTQTVHLDTDAKFQNTAASPVVFSEDMRYRFTLTSPAGLPSPPALTGMIERIPTTTLAPFSGTLNFMGPSAVTEPSTGRDAAASAVSSTDPAVLAAFTGSGSLGFHVQSAIAEVFNGGGGNVQFQINTFVSGAVEVCYTYGAPQVSAAPTVAAPSAAPAPVVATPLLTG